MRTRSWTAATCRRSRGRPAHRSVVVRRDPGGDHARAPVLHEAPPRSRNRTPRASPRPTRAHGPNGRTVLRPRNCRPTTGRADATACTLRPSRPRRHRSTAGTTRPGGAGGADVVIPRWSPLGPGPSSATAEPLKIIARNATAAKGEPGSPAAPCRFIDHCPPGARSERAESVVYAVDASGPMVASLPMVLNELRRSVACPRPSSGSPSCSSARVFPPATLATPDDAPTSVSASRASSGRTAPATRENQAKPRVGSFRSSPPVGRTPRRARAGVDPRPQVVFLLSRSPKTFRRRRGGGQGLWATIDRLERLNPPVAAAESVP